MTLRIVVVDDDPNTLSVVQKLLRAEGFEVKASEEPRQALQLIEQEPFDVLLSDLVMPEMSGLELIAAARGLRPELRCCVMSGHARDQHLGDEVSWIDKPIDFDRLLDAIENV